MKDSSDVEQSDTDMRYESSKKNIVQVYNDSTSNSWGLNILFLSQEKSPMAEEKLSAKSEIKAEIFSNDAEQQG